MYQQKILEASCAIIVFDAVYADFEMIKLQKIWNCILIARNVFSQSILRGVGVGNFPVSSDSL